MENLVFTTQMTAEVDVSVSDWSKVNEYCEQHGDAFQTVDEFVERLSCDFWKATPEEKQDGVVIRHLDVGSFVEDPDGLTHRLESQHTDLFGDITLTISKDFDAENVEKIS